MPEDQSATVSNQLAKVITDALPDFQRRAADRRDRVSLHLLDAISSIEGDGELGEERLALIMMVALRIKGHGGAAGVVAANALARLLIVLGPLLQL